MEHTLTAKGAAFDPETRERVDPTGLGGIGSALCSCGWLSEQLPSGKQRINAHKAHKAEMAALPADESTDGDSPAEQPVEAERPAEGSADFVVAELEKQNGSYTVQLAQGEKTWNPASTSHDIYGPATVAYTRFPDGGITVAVEKPAEELEPHIKAQPSEELLEALEEEKTENSPEADFAEPAEESVEGEPPFKAQRTFPGNYSIVMAPFAQLMADAAGLWSEAETFKGKLERRVTFGGKQDDVEAFLSVLDHEVESALGALHTWQKEHREERRGQTDMQKFLANRGFLSRFGEEAALRIRESRS